MQYYHYHQCWNGFSVGVVVVITAVVIFLISPQPFQLQQLQYVSCVDAFSTYTIHQQQIKQNVKQKQKQQQQQRQQQQHSKLYSTTIVPTTLPPLFDSPVFSLATLCDFDDNDDDKNNKHNNIEEDDDDDDDNENCKRQYQRTNMNIITYATPVSFAPERIWVIGLYKPTISYKNFVRNKIGTLQVLSANHIPIIPILGGCSDTNYNKQQLCKQLHNCTWIESSSLFEHNADGEPSSSVLSLHPNEPKLLLPDCPYYIRLQCLNIIDAGGHDIAVCKVLSMHTMTTTTTSDDNSSDDICISTRSSTSNYLSTQILRDLDIISVQGRVNDIYRPDSTSSNLYTPFRRK
jgi:flavin reductase (DIM6/NTAB) family NADH-FMN oxidoreductase RutF